MSCIRWRYALLAALAAFVDSVPASAQFTINLVYDATVTAAQKPAFEAAKATWESYITGYQPSNLNLTGLTINASIPAIDGVGNVLGQAGPVTGYFPSNGRVYTATGTMRFDSADVASLISAGSFTNVILHEMAHVIGIGTLWTNNNLYVNGSGEYTGPAALAAYKTEFNQPSATFVPVELEGGTGTANGHWNENNGGSGLTGITQVGTGNDMRNELMTGWLNSPAFISNMTVQSFADLGYTVAPVPEPASVLAIAAAALVGAWGVRRRTRRSAGIPS